MENKKHAKFSFSKLPMLQNCPHWVGGLPSAEATRGTEMHKAIQQAFVDGDVIDGSEGWAVDYVREVFNGLMVSHYEIEKHIATSIDGVAGYADFVFSNREDFAVIVEIKTGWTDRGHVKDSMQIKGMSLGLLEQGFQTVACFLVEVDKRTSTGHSYTIDDLADLRKDVIGIVADVVQRGEYGVGKQCAYCAKSIYCPALNDAIANFNTALEDVKGFTPEMVSKRLDAYYDKAAIIAKYIADLKSRAIAIIEAGGTVKGWTVKETTQSRQWIDEAEAAWQILERYPDALISTILSPAKVEKAIKEYAKPKEIRELLSELTVVKTKKSLERE